MTNEKKILPDGSADSEQSAEHEIETSRVGVSAQTESEGSSPTPAEKLEQIAAEHDVPIEKDPKATQTEAETSTDKERNLRGEDSKEDDDTSAEPPD